MLNASNAQKRKLILHFDQHNTIQISCEHPKRNLREALNHFLSSVVWGEEIDNKWIWRCTEPQLDKPNVYPSAITYYKYLEKKLVNSSDNRQNLYKKSQTFTQDNEEGQCFKKFIDKYMNSLLCQKTVPINKSVPNTIHDEESNKLCYLIIPIFFDMIKKLKEEHYEFAIILRSYGSESERFLKTVKSVLNTDEFKHLNIPLHETVGGFKRDDKNQNNIKLEFDNKIYEKDLDIYNKLNSINGICAIRDHFEPWRANNYSCYYAKPIWLKLDDDKHQHIFFDDNISYDMENSCIVNLRLLCNTNETHILDFKSYKFCANSILIKLNLIEVFESNENTFFNKILLSQRLFNENISVLSNIKSFLNYAIN